MEQAYCLHVAEVELQQVGEPDVTREELGVLSGQLALGMHVVTHVEDDPETAVVGGPYQADQRLIRAKVKLRLERVGHVVPVAGVMVVIELEPTVFLGSWGVEITKVVTPSAVK